MKKSLKKLGWYYKKHYLYKEFKIRNYGKSLF